MTSINFTVSNRIKLFSLDFLKMIKVNRTSGLILIASSVFFTFFFLHTIRNGWYGYEHWENFNQAKDANSPAVKANEFFHTLNPEDFVSIRERRANFTVIEAGKANACILVILDETDLNKWRPTMRQIEDRFNKKYKYPYVFLSPLPFTPRFKLLVASLTASRIEFGRIPHKQWKIPSHIDFNRARKAREDAVINKIHDGDSLPYRFKSRYMSGFFFQHELTKKYDYYWKLDAESELSCDMFQASMDPFVELHNKKKLFGFTISVHEIPETLPSLWETAKSYSKHQDFKPSKTDSIQVKRERAAALNWVSSDEGNTYNMCHIWPAMEVGDFDFFRNSHYMNYFNHLDKSGGFFYERWGDGPIKTIYIGLYKSLSQIEFFNYIGFSKFPYKHCPSDIDINMHCFCDPKDRSDFEGFSCNKDFFKLTENSF